MRRVISWILVAATLLGFIGMIAFSVFATGYVERVYIDTPMFQAGDAVTTDFDLKITNAELVEVKGWFDADWQPAGGSFIANEIYHLRLELAAPEGQAFSQTDTVVYPNGYGMYDNTVSPDGKTMVIDIEFNFSPIQVQRISVEGMPEEIQPGEATVPEGMYLMGSATIASARWVDLDKQPVTALEFGRAYFLELTFAPEEGYEFRNWVDIYGHGGMPYSDQIVSTQEAKAWFQYSLQPGVGLVQLTVTGLEVGKSVADLQVTVQEGANVTVRSVLVWDHDTNELVKTGNFEKCMRYDITYVLAPKDGYDIEEFEIEFVQPEVTDWSEPVWNGLLQVNHLFDTYETLEDMTVVSSGLELGAPVSGVAMEIVSGNHVSVEQILVMEKGTGEELTEGTFQKDKNYLVMYKLVAEEGYAFKNGVKIRFNGKTITSGENGNSLWIDEEFSTVAQEAWEVYISAPLEIQPGEATVPELGVDGDAVPVSARWVDEQEQPVTQLLEGRVYYLELTLAPDEGMVFGNRLDIYGDGLVVEKYRIESAVEAKAYIRYSLIPGVGDVELTVTGLEVGKPISGVQVTVPEDSKVTVTGVKVFLENTEEELQTGNFEKGNRYDVRYYLEAKPGYDIRNLEGLSIVDGDFDSWESDGKTLTVQQIFSTCEPLGKVVVTESGVAEGAPVSGVQITVPESANVTVTDLQIYDDTDGAVVESGVFQKNHTYEISYLLAAKHGYHGAEGVDLEWNGDLDSINRIYYTEGSGIRVHVYFSTCTQVDEVELTMQEPVEGGKVEDATVAVTKGQCAIEYTWIDEQTYEEAQGTFQKGHKYMLSFTLHPEEGYVFHSGTKVRLNGEKVDRELGFAGDWCECWTTYSFLEKIERVELPWVPQSLAMGDALPEVTVDENASYTIEGDWYNYAESKICTQVTGNGSYSLEVSLWPKDGYEFAEDLEVVIGGQTYTGYFESYGDYLYLIKTYNVGLQLIHRVDITLPEPVEGMTPKSGSFDGKNYVFADDSWVMGTEANDLEDAANCATFQSGYYHYYGFILAAEDGYGFTEDVDVYVNGKKATVARNINLGYVLDVYVNLGKLPELGSEGPGDVDGYMGITEDDAVYLLQAVLMPDIFPVEQEVDFDGSGTVDEDDAVYLLQHILMPDLFPL